MAEVSSGALDALKAHYRRLEVGDWRDTSIFDPYAVLVFPDPAPTPTYGLEAMRDYTRRFLASWEDFRIEPDRFEAFGDTFVVRVRLIGTGSGGRVPLDEGARAYHVWTFRGTKVVRLEAFFRESDALEAVAPSG